jgi:flagellar hook-associated protein FlgK
MAGLTSTLEIARRTLLNEQILIQTASHNIANAENKTYARQKVTLTTNAPERIPSGWMGTGASIDRIIQVRDQYIERQLMTSTAQESDFRTRASFLELIGTYLKDDGNTGISQDLGRFWDAWDALSTNPDGIVAREGVISAAERLAGTLKSANSDLSALKEKIQTQTGDTVTKINTLLSRIADYNNSISGVEYNGRQANDLRDLRYKAIADLSELAGITYAEETDGSITVSLKDGATSVTLVSNEKAGSLSFSQSTGLVSYKDADGNDVAPDPNDLSGGTLAGLLASAQKTSDFSDRIDTLAGELIEQVNDLYDSTHAQTVFDGNSAADIAVNSTFRTPGNILADQASDIADLEDTELADLDDSRFVDYLGAVQQQIGMDQEDAASRADFQQALAEHLETQRQSVSGVSVDEEMIDLLQFQQVYQAAAKVVNTTRELLDTVIGMVG